MKKSKSKISQPVQSRSQALYDSILQGAILCFSKMGYDQSTTNKIAEVAGVSIGSLYRYFPDKNYILKAAIQEFMKHNRKYFITSIQKNKELSLSDLVEKLIDSSIKHFTTQKSFFVILMTRMFETGSIEQVFSGRLSLALEIGDVLKTHYPELKDVDRHELQQQLYQGIQAYIPALFAAIITGSELTEVDRLKRNMNLFFNTLIEQAKISAISTA